MTPAAALLLTSALVVGVAARAGADDDLGSAASPEVPSSLRLLVKLAHPLPEATRDDPAEIARRATEAAGQAVTYGAAVNGDWSTLQLACAPAECESAVQRLRDAKGLFAVVERDERRQRHNRR